MVGEYLIEIKYTNTLLETGSSNSYKFFIIIVSNLEISPVVDSLNTTESESNITTTTSQNDTEWLVEGEVLPDSGPPEPFIDKITFGGEVYIGFTKDMQVPKDFQVLQVKHSGAIFSTDSNSMYKEQEYLSQK